MTTPTTETLAPVTEADRDAAASVEGGLNVRLDMRNGLRDDHRTVQAFARHRITSIEANSPNPIIGESGALQSIILETVYYCEGDAIISTDTARRIADAILAALAATTPE